MPTIRTTKPEHYPVTHCPICNGEHTYDFQAVIEEEVGVMHMIKLDIEIRPCAVTCPEKGNSFVVDVPVTLFSGQTLVDLQ